MSPSAVMIAALLLVAAPHRQPPCTAQQTLGRQAAVQAKQPAAQKLRQRWAACQTSTSFPSALSTRRGCMLYVNRVPCFLPATDSQHLIGSGVVLTMCPPTDRWATYCWVPRRGHRLMLVGAPRTTLTPPGRRCSSTTQPPMPPASQPPTPLRLRQLRQQPPAQGFVWSRWTWQRQRS